MCGYVCIEHSIRVEVRGKLGRRGFLLVALCVFWGPNTGHQACILGWKEILPSEHLAGPPPCAFIIALKSPSMSLSSHIDQLLELSI